MAIEESDRIADCEACSLANGQAHLPGGTIFETGLWLVEHCVGSLGLGTLIVKPKRHVTAVGDLTDYEAAELGPLLRDASDIARKLVAAEQVYNCLWSHTGGQPVHIHYVIQPVTRQQMDESSTYGPFLQTAMFSAAATLVETDVEAMADAARRLFGVTRRSGSKR